MTDSSLDRTIAAPGSTGVAPSGSALVTLAVAGSASHPQVTVAGEVDCSSAPEVRVLLDQLVDGAPTEIVVDLTGVTFLDSAGLSVLAAAHRQALAAGGRLRVVATTRAVIRPLQITGLWNLLDGRQVDPPAC